MVWSRTSLGRRARWARRASSQPDKPPQRAPLKLIAVCVLLVVWALPTSALGTQGSHGDLQTVGKCFTIHGRLSAYNGTPSLRIWKIGTHRMFGILPDEGAGLPKDVARVFRPFDTEIYGDFLVCPLTRSRSGYMQMVSLKSAKNIVVKHPGKPASGKGP